MKAIKHCLAVLAARGGAPGPEWVTQLIFGASAVLAMAALMLVYCTRRRITNSIYADGEVINFQKQSNHRGGMLHAPVIRFETSDKSIHTITSSIFSQPPAFRIGDKVKVLYPAGKPQQAEYVGVFAQWGGAIICGIISAGSCLIGVCFYFSSHGWSPH